jgi:hypothetical protein
MSRWSSLDESLSIGADLSERSWQWVLVPGEEEIVKWTFHSSLEAG